MSALRNTIKLAIILLFAQPATSFSQQYYKWVDSKGVTNYSARQPAASSKKLKINTVSTYADGSRSQNTQRQFKSNSNIPDTQYQYYSNNSNTQQYRTSAPQQRSEPDEALRQKVIKEASTIMPGAKGLTADQRNILAAESGVNVSSSPNKSYSAPMPQRQPSSISNCDGSGCWGTDGTRYNRGAGDTYFPSNGGVCQNVGGQMQCN